MGFYAGYAFRSRQKCLICSLARWHLGSHKQHCLSRKFGGHQAIWTSDYVGVLCPLDEATFGIIVVGDPKNNSPPAHPNICRLAGQDFRVNPVDNGSSSGAVIKYPKRLVGQKGRCQLVVACRYRRNKTICKNGWPGNKPIDCDSHKRGGKENQS